MCWNGIRKLLKFGSRSRGKKIQILPPNNTKFEKAKKCLTLPPKKISSSIILSVNISLVKKNHAINAFILSFCNRIRTFEKIWIRIQAPQKDRILKTV